MSSDPQNPNDFELTDFDSPEFDSSESDSPEFDSPDVAIPPDSGEEEPLFPVASTEEEEPPAEAEPPKKGKKGKKPKKEKKARGESGGTGQALGRMFPDVYSVMLMIALVAILVAIAVLAVELSRYDFDIKASTAMLGNAFSAATVHTPLA